MGLFNWFKAKAKYNQDFATVVDRENSAPINSSPLTVANRMAEEIFKAYIPEYLYKPPYGYPRRANLPYLKQISKNPYVFSVIKTLCDEAASMSWDIEVKEEYQDDGNDYQPQIDEIRKFFREPNQNYESMEQILRMLITGICEVDAGIIVKVFNAKGEMKQIFARDGATFLKNPNIFGYIGDRADFIPPSPMIQVHPNEVIDSGQIRNYYDTVLSRQAAYFQYGWTAGAMPVPFGKREVVYIMQNPRPDSVYGRSPIEVLGDVILTLVYGSTFNLDFYTNNNMPEGVISLIGAQEKHITQFRKNFESQFKMTDEYGKRRKKFFSYPIVSNDVKFTPFQLLAKDLEVISQQTWFTKILWMCFGVTADEMGFTETSNRAIATEQAKVFKRKAIRPLLSVIQHFFNCQLLPEFFNNAAYSDIPVEFKFNDYDIEEDLKKLNVLQMELNLGIKTSEMIAKERGIDVEELKASKEEAMERQQEMFGEEQEETEETEQPEEEPETPSFRQTEEKAKKEQNPDKEMAQFIKQIGNSLVKEIDNIGEEEWQNF